MSKVSIIRRNIRFNLPSNRILDWHRNNNSSTAFYNTLSVFFPVGERFFIDSARNYMKEVDNPELIKEIRGFIGQEAFHGREHEDYNNLQAAAGIDVKRQEKIVLELLNFARKYLPKDLQLAVTVSLEHLTGIMGGALLESDTLIQGSVEEFRELWLYHATEESEHKAVVFDLYREVIGGDENLYPYFLRTFSLILAVAIFTSLLVPFLLSNIKDSGGFSIEGAKELYRITLGKKGILRVIRSEFFDWFKPGFHPWDHDNRELVKTMQSKIV